MEYGPFLREKFEYISRLPVKEQVKELMDLSPRNRGVFTQDYRHTHDRKRAMSEETDYIKELIENIDDPLELHISIGVDITATPYIETPLKLNRGKKLVNVQEYLWGKK